MLERYSRCRLVLTVAAWALTASIARGQNGPTPSNGCGSLPGYTQLKAALTAATIAENSGLKNQMWGTIVDRDGVVCAVANTANAFSLDSGSFSNGKGQAAGLALSTANLYSAVQPGGSLFGLQESNPVNPNVAYAPAPDRY